VIPSVFQQITLCIKSLFSRIRAKWLNEKTAIAPDRVEDSEVLFRSVEDGKNYAWIEGGQLKVSSQAFMDRNNKPSVDRARLVNDDPGRSQKSASDGILQLLTVEVRAEPVVENNQDGDPVANYLVKVDPDPIPPGGPLPENPAHALISLTPNTENKKLFRKLRERLALLAMRRPWAVNPQSQRGAG